MADEATAKQVRVQISGRQRVYYLQYAMIDEATYERLKRLDDTDLDEEIESLGIIDYMDVFDAEELEDCVIELAPQATVIVPPK